MWNDFPGLWLCMPALPGRGEVEHISTTTHTSMAFEKRKNKSPTKYILPPFFKKLSGFVNAFLAAALTRVMRAAVPIPAVASASVLHSAAVGGSVVGVVRPL